jgi:hypothetical protein
MGLDILQWSLIFVAVVLLFLLARLLRNWIGRNPAKKNVENTPALQDEVSKTDQEFTGGTREKQKVSTRLEKIMANAFLAIIVTVASFIVIEFASRQFLVADNPFKDIAKVRDLRVPKPYVTFGGVPNSGALNKLGYPGPAPTIDKANGEIRIAVLGGSTVMLGPPTITDLIQSELDERGIKDARVYNFGTAGSNSTQDYARLIFEVADYKPDIVVFYNGGNDILSRSPDQRVGYPYNFLLWEANPIIEPSLDTYPAFTLFWFGSAVLRTVFPDYFEEAFIQGAYRNGVQPLLESDPQFAEILADHYLKMSTNSAMFAKMIGAKPIIMFQPIMYYKKNKSAWEARNSITNTGFLGKVEKFRHRVVQSLTELDKSGVSKSVNMTEVFDLNDNKNPIYSDFIHLTPAGNKQMAHLVANQLIEAFPGLLKQ